MKFLIRIKIFVIKLIYFYQVNFKFDINELNFINHNIKKNKFYKTSSSKKIVLNEFTNMQSSIIAQSYFINYYKTNEDCKIVSYFPYKIDRIIGITSWIIQKIFKSKLIKISNSIGVNQFLSIKINKKEKFFAKKKYYEIVNNIKSKEDIENLKIDNIEIGDLLYDYFLRKYEVATINIKSKLFKKFLIQTLEIYYFWLNYFKNNQVIAINVTHCCYVNGIPLRIAINHNIPSFLFSAVSVYRLSKNNHIAWNDVENNKSHYNLLNQNQKKQLIDLAKKQIKRRFDGEVGIDMPYSSKSAFSNFKNFKVLNNNKKIKVLIAAHCFLDSPHSYGKNLFPDFYEWIIFLGNCAKKTKYDWYIKTHPDYLPKTDIILKEIISNYPSIKIIPSDTSHIQIVREGINFVLTVYGTIAFEYAMMDIPVINASVNNPHFTYNFNLNPINKDEYEKLILNLSNIKININKNDIYQYYVLKHLIFKHNWLFNDYNKMINELGGYKQQFKSRVYSYWLNEYDEDKEETIQKKLNYFMNSNEYILYSH